MQKSESNDKKYNAQIAVEVEVAYIENESSPQNSRYAFAYTITINNDGAIPAKLLSRHWTITDANGQVKEVVGDGVVGEQPYLKPGEGFQYTSGAILDTPIGTMAGSYLMCDDNGEKFYARIPEFILSGPRILH